MLSNMKQVGFIGCGKMGGAIISGILKCRSIKVSGAEATDELAKSASERLGIDVTSNTSELVLTSDIVFIALKPNLVLDTLNKVKESFRDSSKVIVSVAAGITTKKIEETLDSKISVIRAMPNTPALIGQGVFGIAKGSYANNEQVDKIIELLSGIGTCVKINESEIDIVTALSGSGPAFFYKVINELAHGAANLGLEYDKALKLAVKTAIGSAKMIEKSNLPVETLISNVATKGGCTAVGVDYMNNINTGKIFAELIKITTDKAASLG